jgi:hypothetical protein
MEGIGIKHQSYEIERKRSTNVFMWLLNILIHNAFVLHGKIENISWLPGLSNERIIGRLKKFFVLEDH